MSADDSTKECMLCFEEAEEPLTGCAECKKAWCMECDVRWRITRAGHALLPSCPFCRHRLESLSTDPPVAPTTQPVMDRIMISLLRWISYLLLAIVLMLIPLVEAFLSQSDEAFIAYFCLILFVFVFLCCHYVHVHCPDGRDDDDEAVLSVV